MYRRLFLVSLISYTLCACGDEQKEPITTSAYFEIEPTEFFNAPFPAEHRRTQEGFVDFSGFPQSDNVGLLELYVDYANTNLTGFSTNGAIFFRFEKAIPEENIPDPQTSMSENSDIFLVNIDSNCSAYGTQYPVLSQFYNERTDYIPENLLAVMPYPGFPLQENCMHAALVMKKLIPAKDIEFQTPSIVQKALAGDDVQDTQEQIIVDSFSALRDFIDAQKITIASADIAIATVFKTQKIIEELQTIREYIINDLPLPTLQDIDELDTCQQICGMDACSDTCYTAVNDGNYAFNGHYNSPNFQNGEIPYEQTGGGFLFDSNNEPIIDHSENLRFRLVVPKGSPMPENGWPIVVYAHGTGGDYKTFHRNDILYPATVLTAKSMAVIGIDQPLHGTRTDGKNFNVELMSFNVFNPDAGRTVFRQSAIDTFVLVNALKNGVIKVDAAVSPTGSDIIFNPNQIMFLGHSQGGITGAVAMGLETEVETSVHSGTGGMISGTLAYDDYYHSLMQIALGIPEAEIITLLHPAMMLIQTIVDISDPVNYAPYYYNHPVTGQGRNMLFTMGYRDVYTSYQTNNILTAAAAIPALSPGEWDSLAHDLRGLDPVDSPVSLNMESHNLSRYTAAVLQLGKRHEHADHFLIFDDEPSIETYSNFFDTYVKDGVAVIEY